MDCGCWVSGIEEELLDHRSFACMVDDVEVGGVPSVRRINLESKRVKVVSLGVVLQRDSLSFGGDGRRTAFRWDVNPQRTMWFGIVEGTHDGVP